MTLVKFNQPVSNFFDKSNPLFNEWNNLLKSALPQEDFAGFVPPVNISEDRENYYLELSVPGYTKEELKLEQEKNTLRIVSERTNFPSEKTYSRKEFTYGSFKRIFTLPETVNMDKINAKMENGILTIMLAKKEEAIPKPAREIEIL